MTRIVLADDHALVRSGMRALLEQMSELEVVGEASDGHEALERVAELTPDILLVNISMPVLNGIGVTQRVVAEHPRTKVIVVSLHSDPEYVRRAFADGAVGYVLKSATRSELELAIRAVRRGDIWIDPGISKLAVEALLRGEEPPTEFALLTPRQREILQMIAEEHSSKDIAVRTGLSVKTVESHRAALMKRLDVDSVAGLVRAAIRIGLASSSGR